MKVKFKEALLTACLIGTVVLAGLRMPIPATQLPAESPEYEIVPMDDWDIEKDCWD